MEKVHIIIFLLSNIDIFLFLHFKQDASVPPSHCTVPHIIYSLPINLCPSASQHKSEVIVRNFHSIIMNNFISSQLQPSLHHTRCIPTHYKQQFTQHRVQ